MSSTDFDYTLSFEFERCSLVELRGISRCLLLGGSSMCLPDFYDLVGEMVQRMRKVGYDLIQPENRDMVQFLQDIFVTLKKLNRGYPPTQLILLIKEEFNMYCGLNTPSPEISPVTSPEVKVPKIMKKVKNKLKN